MIVCDSLLEVEDALGYRHSREVEKVVHLFHGFYVAHEGGRSARLW